MCGLLAAPGSTRSRAPPASLGEWAARCHSPAAAAGLGFLAWYVGAALRLAQPNLRVCLATAVAMLTATGCAGERRDAGVAQATYRVALQRASFAPAQRLAQRNTLVITVRNTGQRTLPNLVVTLRGLTDRGGGARNADTTRDLWIVDRAPAGSETAFEDRWAGGRLAAGESATLRWVLVPAVAGRHEVSYDVAASLAGPARVELTHAPGAQRSLVVRVSDAPAKARVDPSTGAVRRQE